MIIAMNDTAKQDLAFFNRHARRMIPVLAYQKIDKTNVVEIREWKNRLILLGAVDSAQQLAKEQTQEKVSALENAKEKIAILKSGNLGLVATLADFGPGVSLR